MRIDDHIFETILIGIIFTPMLLIILPFFNFTNFSLIFFFIFFGLFCGAMYPDTDCPKSSIFKMKQDTRKIGWQNSFQKWKEKKNARDIKNFFLYAYSSCLMPLGYLFRYLIYYPTLKLIQIANKKYINEDEFKKYDFPDEHRGISHTVLGIMAATILFFSLFFLVNLYFKWISTNYILVSTITFFVGGNIHLLQDSISKYGIKWFHPFNKKQISGDYSSFIDDSRITFLNVSLIGTIFLNYFVINYISINLFNKLLSVSIISLLPFVSLFLIFLVLFRSCRVKITNN